MNRTQIANALRNAAEADDFHSEAFQLCGALGYSSPRLGPRTPFTAPDFVHRFPSPFQTQTQSEIRFLEQVQTARILFQITDDEVEFQPGSSAWQEIDEALDQSFLFASVELKGGAYNRMQYAELTREINKRLPLATVVLFRTRTKRISLALANRRERLNNPEGRAVLGRVSLLREIDPGNMRTDADILEELTLPNRLRWIAANAKKPNFDGLRGAWLDALDIEKLNGRFYKNLFEWYQRACGDAKFPKTEPPDTEPPDTEPPEKHVVRLITRFLFVWFMKEKGLVHPDLFNPAAVRPLLKNGREDAYYTAVLQNLFFACLNTPIQSRDFSKRNQTTHRLPNRYRYKDLMTDSDALVELFKRSPFINGGLFECLDDFEGVKNGGKRIDCFTDNKKQREDLSVPDNLFFGDPQDDRRQDGAVSLIPLLNRYKFTVSENTPYEQEVALDPELLGNVFEQLLDDHLNNRKKTGSYYTPRAVVDYMTNEAVAAALERNAEPRPDRRKNEVWRDDIDALLDEEAVWDEAGELFKDGEKERLLDVARNLKILDPAVGSGAFPMTALLKLNRVLKRLGDPGSDYERKLRLIRNNIFGVDIQPIACMIAKLRFFISLAVDQEPNGDPKDNYGFEPLPNLETRFICADALLKLDRQGTLLTKRGSEIIQNDMKENEKKYFSAKLRRKKTEIKKEFIRLRKELIAEMTRVRMPPDVIQRVAQWNPYSQTAPAANWFDPQIMFSVENSFDIVIGNPPYVRLQKDGGRLGKRYKNAGFETFARTGDIYCLFYERALQLAKANGLVCLITSNKWMRSDYGQKLRDHFVLNAQPLQLLDLGPDVFDATVDTNILLVRNSPPVISASMQAVKMRGDFDRKEGRIDRYMGENEFDMPIPRVSLPWAVLAKTEQAVLDKMRQIGTPLMDWGSSMYIGVISGYNKAFLIDRETRENLIAQDPRSAEIIGPVLRGRNIYRWLTFHSESPLQRRTRSSGGRAPAADALQRRTRSSGGRAPAADALQRRTRSSGGRAPAADALQRRTRSSGGRAPAADALHEWLITTFPALEIDIEKYPAVRDHLLSFGKDRLEQSGKSLPGEGKSRKKTKHAWFETADVIAYHQEFQKERLMWRDIAKIGHFAYFDEPIYCTNTAYIITGKSLKYLCAVLNSQLVAWYMKNTASDLGKDAIRWFRTFVRRIPVPHPTPSQEASLVRLVDAILTKKRSDPEADVSALEEQIEDQVCRLYRLTDEERAAVSASLSPAG